MSQPQLPSDNSASVEVIEEPAAVEKEEPAAVDEGEELSVTEPSVNHAAVEVEEAVADKEEPADVEPAAVDEVEPWLRFRVGNLGTANHRSRREFFVVHHVTHFYQALRIVEDQKIRADLIKDKSKLNASRTLVAWVSPKNWPAGYMYGSIRFQIPWARLVRGKKYYWVETMDYRPIACRILVSDKHYEKLKPYDPAKGEGPWIVENERHYFNDEYCLEILIEGDIPLSQVATVDFVEHHQEWCTMNKKKLASLCDQSKKNASYVGACFVGELITRDLTLKLPGFTRDIGGVQSPSESLHAALIVLRDYYNSLGCSDWGMIQADHPCAPALARAAIAASKDDDAMRIRSLFVNAAAFNEILGDVLAESIGVSRDSLRAWAAI
jgi:hypothetical protein